MRLGQLSRQLDISSDKIVKLLQDNFREVNNHPNVKLTEEELAFIQSQFQPIIEEVEPQEKEVFEDKVEVSAEENVETSTEPETPEFIESLRPQVITLEEEFHAQTDGLEVYKAEKPHLEGLKVVGKIDLPEPVVKEPKEEATKPERKPRERNANRRDRNSRGRKRNALSPAEERKKAERLALKKKYEQEQRLKELKRKHYEENVKAKLTNSAPKKKKKSTKEPVAHLAPTTQSVYKGNVAKKSAPKTSNPLKRFWLWLNGAYDN